MVKTISCALYDVYRFFDSFLEEPFITINAMRSERVWPEEYIPRLRLLGEIFVNALQRAETKKQLEERLRMEQLLAALSSRFLNASSERVEREVASGLRQVAEFLGIERGVLAQVFADRGKMTVTHSWAAPAFEKKTGDLISGEAPWIFSRIMRAEAVVFERPDDLPAEAAQDKEYLQATGCLSCLFFPLTSGGEVLGFVGFESLSMNKSWPDEMVRLLQVAAQPFANALARKRADQALRESEARLDLAASSANAGLWVVDLRDGHIWMTNKTRELFSFSADSALTFDIFLDMILPEDREAVRQAVQQAVETGENVSVEYRAMLSDGSFRWMVSRGKAYFKPSGEPDHLTGVTQDISDRKRMQGELATALEEWQTTFDSVHDMVMILDREHRIRRVNAAAAVFFGLPQEQIIGTACHCLMHGMDSSREGCPAVLAFQTGRHEEVELFHEQKKAWLLVSADPIRDAGGEVTAVVHTVRDITEVKSSQAALRKAYDEIKQLKEQLEAENMYLREEVNRDLEFEHIIGTSPAIMGVLRQAEQVAATDATVLLTGETGTGKELIAQAIHSRSKRHSRLMVKVNCASLPAALIESELFGREKGAYTGALARQIGRFELADQGTLFLDEITELPPDLQAKLLRVLQSGEFERLGSPKTIHVDVRLISATNRDIAAEVRKGALREDLYYRLNVFPIRVPPLRERQEDIPLLVEAFVREFSLKLGKKIKSVPVKAMEALQRYQWPGNIRELRNVIEHGVIVSSGSTLQVPLPQPPAGASFQNKTMEETEYQHIMDVLSRTRWRIKGANGAAALLGLKPSTLYSRMNKLGIPNRREKVDISS